MRDPQYDFCPVQTGLAENAQFQKLLTEGPQSEGWKPLPPSGDCDRVQEEAAAPHARHAVRRGYSPAMYQGEGYGYIPLVEVVAEEDGRGYEDHDVEAAAVRRARCPCPCKLM